MMEAQQVQTYPNQRSHFVQKRTKSRRMTSLIVISFILGCFAIFTVVAYSITANWFNDINQKVLADPNFLSKPENVKLLTQNAKMHSFFFAYITFLTDPYLINSDTVNQIVDIHKASFKELAKAGSTLDFKGILETLKNSQTIYIGALVLWAIFMVFSVSYAITFLVKIIILLVSANYIKFLISLSVFIVVVTMILLTIFSFANTHEPAMYANFQRIINNIESINILKNPALFVGPFASNVQLTLKSFMYVTVAFTMLSIVPFAIADAYIRK